MRKSDGFTLVELLVGILCATLVTGAAMTLLLMGARSNRALFDTTTEQQTARIITTMVESLASEGSIKKVVVYDENRQTSALEPDAPEPKTFDWALLDQDDNVILSYSYDNQTIYTNESSSLMEGVKSSTLTLSKNTLGGSLLGFTIQTEEGYYETSAYCRTLKIETEGNVLDKENVSAEVTLGGTSTTILPEDSSSLGSDNPLSSGRFALLEVLCTQYGSTGQITPPYDGTYYSEWYLQNKYGKNYSSYSEDWNKDTAWCACFISWGLGQISSEYLDYNFSGHSSDRPYFAAVDAGYRGFSGTLKHDDNLPDLGDWRDRKGYTPYPGDLIFFDWQNELVDTWSKDSADIDHVGVVFYVDAGYVYTLEGNTNISTSRGSVDLKRYDINDKNIIGYGVLDWLPTPTT